MKQIAPFHDRNPKNLQYKRKIIEYFITNESDTLTNLAKELDISVPTANKFVCELCDAGLIENYGKLETSGGRHPYLYGLCAQACYFIGVDFGHGSIHLALMDFTGKRCVEQMNIPFVFENTPETLENICREVERFIAREDIPSEKVVGIGVNIFGRLNPSTGYTYTYFNFDEKPLADKLSERFGIKTYIDNDTRACAYGEFMVHYREPGYNMLFVNVAWGLGLGIVIDGEPYDGKSGFSGEFGHIHAYDNEILCHCGKKGCLETEASGSAMYRKFIEKVSRGDKSILTEDPRFEGEKITHIHLEDLVEATRKEDIMCIEILEEVGEQLGIHLAGLINIFNPHVVVIGGVLASTGDYLMQPLQSAIRKYSLNMVNQDTELLPSRLKVYAGVMGACMLARKKAVASITSQP